MDSIDVDIMYHLKRYKVVSLDKLVFAVRGLSWKGWRLCPPATIKVDCLLHSGYIFKYPTVSLIRLDWRRCKSHKARIFGQGYPQYGLELKGFCYLGNLEAKKREKKLMRRWANR